MKDKRPPNHIDDPELYVPISCACCKKCWRHKDYYSCIHGGPFEGYVKVEEKK